MKINNYKVGLVFTGTIGRERKNKFQYFNLGNTKDRELTSTETDQFILKAKEKIKSEKGKVLKDLELKFYENTEDTESGINQHHILAKFKKPFDL